MKFKLTALSLVLTSVLAGCGGSDSGDDTMSPPDQQQPDPTFALAISDAPVEALSAVVACFNTLELKREGADNLVFTVGTDPQMLTANDLCKDSSGDVIPNTVGIDLMQYAGVQSTTLLGEVSISAGIYIQLRLGMAEGSYATLKDTGVNVPVSVPSNELKLDGFTAALGGTLAYTLEFDLRKAMTDPVGQEGYFLKPRGVRLVNNSTVGHIHGSVDETLLMNNGCTTAPADTSTPVAVVYLYQGMSLNADTLADNGGNEGLEPLASTSVTYDGASSYQYEIGFVPAGDYTLSLTCDTLDDPEADDEIGMLDVKETSVTSGQTSTVNFTAE